MTNVSGKTTNDNELADFVKTCNPDVDLINYAKKNNISNEEAKEILYKAYGEPERPNEDSFNKIALTGDPNKDALNYALANNLSLNEAKAVLYKTFGVPERPDGRIN